MCWCLISHRGWTIPITVVFRRAYVVPRSSPVRSDIASLLRHRIHFRSYFILFNTVECAPPSSLTIIIVRHVAYKTNSFAYCTHFFRSRSIGTIVRHSLILSVCMSIRFKSKISARHSPPVHITRSPSFSPNSYQPESQLKS